MQHLRHFSSTDTSRSLYIWTVQWHHVTSDIHNTLTGITGQFPFIMLSRDDRTTHGRIILWTRQTILTLHW